LKLIVSAALLPFTVNTPLLSPAETAIIWRDSNGSYCKRRGRILRGFFTMTLLVRSSVRGAGGVDPAGPAGGLRRNLRSG
jgi:hypothetical protein